jgi:hypothetical protein
LSWCATGTTSAARGAWIDFESIEGLVNCLPVHRVCQEMNAPLQPALSKSSPTPPSPSSPPRQGWVARGTAEENCVLPIPASDAGRSIPGCIAQLAEERALAGVCGNPLCRRPPARPEQALRAADRDTAADAMASACCRCGTAESAPESVSESAGVRLGTHIIGHLDLFFGGHA